MYYLRDITKDSVNLKIQKKQKKDILISSTIK